MSKMHSPAHQPCGASLFFSKKTQQSLSVWLSFILSTGMRKREQFNVSSDIYTFQDKNILIRPHYYVTQQVVNV